MTQRTALFSSHKADGAKMVSFAGFDMPIQYKEGMLAEHEWVRAHAGVFDVSHMGQLLIQGEGAEAFLSFVTPTDFSTIEPLQARYTVLLNEEGGICDDLIITKLKDEKFFVVINAACKNKDIDWLNVHKPDSVSLTLLEDSALLAIQGPKAEDVLCGLIGGTIKDLAYMHIVSLTYQGHDIFVSRTGYTGEDGFEISVPNVVVEMIWKQLLEHEDIKPIGLGARDSLRLEMGYPLYGHDMDDTMSPVGAGLKWVISNGHTKYLGHERIRKELDGCADKQRVGIKVEGRAIAREGAMLFNKENQPIGVVTSGGFSPSLKQTIGQAVVKQEYAGKGQHILVSIRGKYVEAVLQSPMFMKPRTKSVKKI